MKRSYRIFIIAIVLIAIAGFIYWITTNFRPEVSDFTDYSNMDNWAIYEDGQGRADLFFICPTVDLGLDGNMNMRLDDEVTKASFLGASKMELGIYDEDAGNILHFVFADSLSVLVDIILPR